MKAMEEIGSKLSPLHHGIEVAIGSGNDPHVYRNLSLFADSEHTGFLENAQQLGLEGIVQLANLVEEKDTAFGGANQALTITIRPGKRAAPMPEQLALGEAGADRTAVEGHEGPIAALEIELVNGMRQEFLACSRLTRDQDRQITQSADPQHRAEDREDSLTFSHAA
jgi:hypothetical protein